MSRLRADLLLAIAGLIWGFGFVAQKDAAARLGAFLFVACRFLISAVFVFPLMLREKGFRGALPRTPRRGLLSLGVLCASFAAAVLLQQVGLETTSVTNASFLTGLYIVLVPFAAYALYRQKLTGAAVGASLLSFFGIWLLAGGNTRLALPGLVVGDWLVLACALCFAVQVPLLGHMATLLRRPFTLSFLQNAVTGLLAAVLAFMFEPFSWPAMSGAWVSIVYAGILSGGVAYTLQAVAQQHTPASDSAVIMSSESFFGAVGGAWLLGDRLSLPGYAGCAAILAAILLVEVVPLACKKQA